nr:hypothetical protein [Tanacetum cinerariifolium]
ESSAPQKTIVIRLRIPPRRSIALTPPTLIPTTGEADDLILQDTLQVTKFMPKRKSHELAKNLEDIMMEALPKLIDDRIKVLLKKQVPLPVVEGLILEREKSQADVAKMIIEAIQRECKNLRLEIYLQVNDSISNHIPSQVDSSIRSYMTGHILPSVIHPRDQDDPHDDAHTEGENSAKR